MERCYKRADVLLPDEKKTTPYQWAVIACDQFTSEPEYWQKAEDTVAHAPSALRVVLPEVYLASADERVTKINKTMQEYLADVFVCHENTAIFVERTQSDGKVRRGIVMAIDLEAYDYKKGANSLIRATEATVVERIPPRVAIRRNAAIELPHVMLLIDDPDRTVIEPLIDGCEGEVAYDTELMLGGGHLKGRFLSERNFEEVSRTLDALITPEAMKARYGADGLAPLLFAVGDGNHSLASAKAAYEEIKARIGVDSALSCPARYALVEIVNLHDDALAFEPIYRVMFGVRPHDVISELEKYVKTLDGNSDAQSFSYRYGETVGSMSIAHPVRTLTVGTLQDFIDGYIQKHPEAEVDYIHGENSVKALSEKQNAIGFTFTGMGKSELFKTVIFDGALPRKTFSMGHAEDKRYYFEARKIVD